MPRKRTKTAADRPAYRAPAPTPLPQELEPYLDALHLRRIVQQYGVQRVLELIAEQQRREMVERRAQETMDGWKSNMRPLAPIRVPRAVASQTWHRCNQTREQSLDNVIAHQTRIRELELGLSVILEQAVPTEFKHQLIEIVDRVRAGETAAQIAAALDVSERTVAERLADLRRAAVTEEEEELSAV